MRTKEMITKLKTHWLLNKFSFKCNWKFIENRIEKMQNDLRVQRVNQFEATKVWKQNDHLFSELFYDLLLLLTNKCCPLCNKFHIIHCHHPLKQIVASFEAIYRHENLQQAAQSKRRRFRRVDFSLKSQFTYDSPAFCLL